MVIIGEKIEPITVKDYEGNSITIGESNKIKIVFFYPKANTSG